MWGEGARTTRWHGKCYILALKLDFNLGKMGKVLKHRSGILSIGAEFIRKNFCFREEGKKTLGRFVSDAMKIYNTVLSDSKKFSFKIYQESSSIHFS